MKSYIFNFIFVIALSGFCFDYVLDTGFDTDIPAYGDMICGVVMAPIIVPTTIVFAVLRCSGVEKPFFGDDGSIANANTNHEVFNR